MAARQRAYFDQGINMYVPKMQYVHDVVHKGIFECSLGTPNGYDEDGIHADVDGDAVAGVTIYSADFVPGTAGIGYQTDALYGQNVVVKVSADPGAASSALDITGEDYLGQPMRERITTANGATAAVEGKKAFKRVTKIVIGIAATNAIVVDVGWGSKLGLPYTLGQVIGGREGTIVTQPSGLVLGPVASFIAADAAASVHVSPIDGYFVGWDWVYTTAMTTAASIITTALNAVDFNAGDFVAPIGAIGLGASPRLSKANWGAIAKGQNITATSDGAGTAGVMNINAVWSYGQGDVANPDKTDPATAITGDPRGLYDPQLAPDGTREYFVQYIADLTLNAGDNGGLHGIRHFIS